MASTLTEFVQIGSRTSLYTPSRPVSGQLIIICTWLGAARKHITKYTLLYQRIAPGARILLIQSAVPILISSYVHQRNAIKPAVFVMLDLLAECGHHSIVSTAEKEAAKGQHRIKGHQSETNGPIHEKKHNKLGAITTTSTSTKTPPKIILHTFSNGGTNTATQLLFVLKEHLRSPLRLSGLLFDSCPAKGTYWKSYDAMILSLPKNVATRLLGAVAVHCILILLYAWIACGNENPASLSRRTLLDKDTVQGRWEADSGEAEAAVTPGRACYLYSKADQMCDWRDVRDHAEDARKKGLQVEEVVFEGSAHCAHFSADEARYVEAVKGVWDGCGSERLRKGNSKL